MKEPLRLAVLVNGFAALKEPPKVWVKRQFRWRHVLFKTAGHHPPFHALAASEVANLGGDTVDAYVARNGSAGIALDDVGLTSVVDANEDWAVWQKTFLFHRRAKLIVLELARHAALISGTGYYF